MNYQIKLARNDLAKFPFLADAGLIIKQFGFNLEDFESDPDLKPVVEKAYDRIVTAARGKSYPIITGDVNDQILLNEVFSFLIAAILLHVSKAHTLVRRFSLAEAQRAEKYLENDLTATSILTEQTREVSENMRIMYILENTFSLTVEYQNHNFTTSVPNYLKRAVKFHEREWKLVNRTVRNGQVILTPHEIIRLLRSETQKLITEKILSMKLPNKIDGFVPYVDKLQVLARELTPKTMIVTGEYPPCIKHAIEVLEKGENLSHSGRFMIATFLLSRGKSVEEIAPLFKNAPDYNEKTTMYQLRHLSGDASSTKYLCPSCEKIKMKDMCFKIDKCNDIINPIQFGRKLA